MSLTLKPYPEYKESRLPWVGKLPSGWKKERAKWLFQHMQRSVKPEDGVVTCFRDGMVTLRSKRRLDGFTESLKEIGYQGVRRGDLVIHAMDAFAGAIGVADSDGKSTPVYSVCAPRTALNIHYYANVVREMARSQWVAALAKGIRERSTDFRYEAFANEWLPFPSVKEQNAIASFIQRIDSSTKRLIRAKRRAIGLLNEQKQAVAHQLLTEGFGTRTIPELGDAWFPLIPRGWSVVPLRRVITSAIDGPHFSPKYEDAGIPFISARNIKVDHWSLEDAKYISEANYQEFSKRVVPELDDVLYTKGGTTGVARVVDLGFRFQVWVHVAVLKLRRDKVLPQYLALALNSPKCYEQSQLFTRGATNQDLGLNRMKNIVLPLPPTVEEQELIVAEAAHRQGALGNAIMQAEKEILLLREYRTRLITDVVTGKLDVREIELPELEDAEETEALSDIDDEESEDSEQLVAAEESANAD